jgi:phosphatidylglycerol:prolipoprotein diacylglycerol transferase
MLFTGIVLGLVIQNVAANARALDSMRVYLASLLLVPVALAGNRLLYVAGNWPAYRKQPSRIWRREDGGGVLYGGLAATLIASVPLLRIIGLPFWAFWDIALFCLLPAIALGRIGCLLHGCCAGRETRSSLSLWLPDENGIWARRVPTQIIEAALALLLLAIICFLPAPRTKGLLFLASLATYAAARTWTQLLRANVLRVRGADLSLAISLILAISSLSLMVLIR